MVQIVPISAEQVACLLKKGRSMPRDRHQRGSVFEEGKRVKKWKGSYYVYETGPNGAEVRKHREVTIGPKAEMKKWEAEKKLEEIIAAANERASGAPGQESGKTLRWFWQERFLPMKEPHWKASSRPKTIRFVNNYVLRATWKGGGDLGSVPMEEITRFDLQMYINDLAMKFSKSVVTKFRLYVNAILEEAIEEDFLSRNPARKLQLPDMKKSCNRALTEEEIIELLGVLSGRDRLIIRMFLVLGLRPGELFALRRNDRIYPSQIRIDESVSEELSGDEKLVTTKTEASDSYVWLPKSIETELDFWLETSVDRAPESFVFASLAGTPINLNNFLNRSVKPAAKRARAKLIAAGAQLPAGFLANINHQAFRRTCATHMQGIGSVKDVQSHLRHSTPAMTIGVYMQQIPASVRAAVEALDQKLNPLSTNLEIN